MRFASLSPLILGVFIVLQAGLNRRISAVWGLSATALLNALVLSTGSALLFALVSFKVHLLPAIFRGNPDPRAIEFWYFIPGLIGLTLVIGAPWAISRWGAAHTFVMVVSAQLLAGVLWDLKIENVPVTKEKWIGIGLTWVGVTLANWSR